MAPTPEGFVKNKKAIARQSAGRLMQSPLRFFWNRFQDVAHLPKKSIQSTQTFDRLV